MCPPARRSVLLLPIALAALCTAPGCGRSGDDGASALPRAAASAPRIVLLLSIDTLRADHLGLYGYSRFTSPTLDALAAEGVVFDDASSTAPWTLPGHASMLTGLNPVDGHRTITYASHLPEDVPTLPGLLAERGWKTAAVVSSAWLKPEDHGVTRDFAELRYVEVPAERRSPSTMITDQAIEWLEGLAAGERLFLFVHHYDVHSDYVSEPEYERLFLGPYEGRADGTGVQLLRANFPDEYLDMCRDAFDEKRCAFGSGRNRVVVDGAKDRVRFDADDVRHLVDLYDAGVRQMDTEIGRLLGYLRDAGLEDETLLVVTSDHGEEFMDHGRMDHFLATWQESLRVPLIVRGPGVPAGVRVAAPVSLIDLAPTVLRAAGIEPPASLHGMDVAPLWKGGDPRPFEERYLYGEASGGLTVAAIVENVFPIFHSVRRGRYKLVHDTTTGAYRLYDLAEDPGEQNDVAARHPDLASELQRELDARRRAGEALSGTRVELDPEERERLRALGYVP